MAVNEQERAAVRRGDFEWHDSSPAAVALSCRMNVWDQGVAGFPHEDRYKLLVDTERRAYCFFRAFQPGMLFLAAEELQRRESATAEARQERRLTIIGLWIAAAALLVGAIIDVIELWP
jgi:hypothetical protein